MTIDGPPTHAVWTDTESLLSQAPERGLNTAVEVCRRWSADLGRIALVVRDPDGTATRWTYAELDRLASRAARVLADAGLRRGDRVAAVLTRQVESLIVALAAWQSGVVYVPLYCGFGADAIASRAETAGVSLVVVDSRFRKMVEDARSLMANDVHVVTVGEPWSGDCSFWDELNNAASDGPEAHTAASDLATLMFTSGTSGAPKACTMPHGAVPALVPFARHALGVGEKSLLFTTADPGWSYGLYSTGVVPMALGVPRVIYTGDFDPAAWWRVIDEESVTCIAGAPSAYRRLAQELAAQGCPRALDTAAAAGEPLPPVVAAAWEKAGGPPIHDGYGLSEVGMVLGDLRSPETGTRPGSLAGPVPGFDTVLVDEQGTVVPDGEPGRIAVRRPRYQLSNGYENAPELWAARWNGDLFVTEDLACREPDGRWRFVGRADDMIITSGFNVSPVEVEDALLREPGVAEAAVVAATDPQRGTVVRAVIVPDDGAPPADDHCEMLRAAVRSRVARYAAPRIVDFVDTLPRTEVGKLRRHALRNQDGEPA